MSGTNPNSGPSGTGGSSGTAASGQTTPRHYKSHNRVWVNPTYNHPRQTKDSQMTDEELREAFGVGVVLLLAGGNWLVDGAVGLARRLGVSTLLIGLTIVAFGTSAPELAFNVMAAQSGHGELSFGMSSFIFTLPSPLPQPAKAGDAISATAMAIRTEM